MSEPLVIHVVDADGIEHWAARDAKFIRDGLADGSLRPAEEVLDASQDAANGDDHDTGDTDGGSGDWPANAAHTDTGDEPGAAEPATDR